MKTGRTNAQRLKRQGRIFNHDGKCGKIVTKLSMYKDPLIDKNMTAQMETRVGQELVKQSEKVADESQTNAQFTANLHDLCVLNRMAESHKKPGGAEAVEAKAETERTPGEQADLKAYKDEDDWRDDWRDDEATRDKI